MNKKIKILVIVLILLIIGLLAYIIADITLETKEVQSTTSDEVETKSDKENKLNETSEENTEVKIDENVEESINNKNSNNNEISKNADTSESTNVNKQENDKKEKQESDDNSETKYTKDQISKMSLDYFEATMGFRPDNTTVQNLSGSYVTIRLWNNYEDNTGDYTLDVYTIDLNTAKGYNSYQEIDLNNIPEEYYEEDCEWQDAYNDLNEEYIPFSDLEDYITNFSTDGDTELDDVVRISRTYYDSYHITSPMSFIITTKSHGSLYDIEICNHYEEEGYTYICFNARVDGYDNGSVFGTIRYKPEQFSIPESDDKGTYHYVEMKLQGEVLDRINNVYSKFKEYRKLYASIC